MCISSPLTCVAITFLWTFLSSNSVVLKFLAPHLQNTPETSEQSSVTSIRTTELLGKIKSVNGRTETTQDRHLSASVLSAISLWLLIFHLCFTILVVFLHIVSINKIIELMNTNIQENTKHVKRLELELAVPPWQNINTTWAVLCAEAVNEILSSICSASQSPSKNKHATGKIISIW